MIDWRLEVLPIKELQEYDRNPREIKKDQMQRLEGLISKYGLIDKPIVNKDWQIIGGHQRIRILKKKRVKTVECWVPDRLLSEEEVAHLCIGLNLNQGKWDWDILANLWEPLDLLNYGFSEAQLVGCQEAEKIMAEQKDQVSKAKKKKICPNCAHEF